ncbi:MAG: hypothetical protein QY322_03625 [bacterium]|nr:MAG: hypothetical protein QY322_03625 [bacterium]
MKEIDIKQKEKWKLFFKNWKGLWRNPSISTNTKAVIFNLFLYRSDDEGWCVSERKMAGDLGIGKNTASKAIDEATSMGYLLTNKSKQRERRKLRLSGSLRSPTWTTDKPKVWVSSEPTKYQSKYKNNIEIKKSDNETQELTKIMSGDELGKKIAELKKKMQI